MIFKDFFVGEPFASGRGRSRQRLDPDGNGHRQTAPVCRFRAMNGNRRWPPHLYVGNQIG